MDRTINIIDYLPSVLKEIKDFKGIADAENPELLGLWLLLEDLLCDQFIENATEKGVKRWESVMNVDPMGTDSIDIRKFNILARLNQRPPYTFRNIANQMTMLCGENGYTMTLNSGTHTLAVRIELIVKRKFDEVNSLLRRSLPANIIIDLSLRYNQHQTIAAKTHAQLATLTYDHIRNEVIS